MKGFPNQVAELPTLTRALQVLSDLLGEGNNPRDDGVYGEALIRRGVLGTGHTPIPVEEYLAQQKTIRKFSNQSYRTRARGLRELFRVLGLIQDLFGTVALTQAGRQVAALGDDTLTPFGVRLWRAVIVGMTHDGGDGEFSHPYQVLLRLVGKRPGITRAKCALALEAKNDSEDELERIASLSDLEQAEIRNQIGVTEHNWNNAKKILPHFAEQLGDVLKVAGERFYLADVPGNAGATLDEQETRSTENGTRTPKGSSSVTAATIAKAGTAEGWDEATGLNQVELDPVALEARNQRLRDRLHRHNLIVQKIANELEQDGAELFENPFDCLARFDDEGLLIEVKSLDGTEGDEVERVREAFAQLLYYAAFVTMPLAEEGAVKKVACFEQKISDAHIAWFEASDIHVLWIMGEGFDGSPEAKTALAGHFGF
jgi:hypothetical protein